MIRITHFRKKCIGCNACIEIAGYRWKMSHLDGKAVLVHAKNTREVFNVIVSDDEADEANLAQNNCPVSIIRVEQLSNH